MISRRILSLQGSRLVRSASLRSAEIRPGGSRSYPPKLFQLRSLSNQQQKQAAEEASKESAELVLTPGQKVVAGTRLTMYAGFAALAAVSAYFIGKELLPSRMSPNSVFDQATKKIREDPQVMRVFGNPIKVYGRDHGGHREGRRNFIEHKEYTSEEDGSQRTRIRFNLEGPNGKGFAFAEVSKDMPAGEFVYLLVQNKQGGRVITLIDNRSRMRMMKMAGSNEVGQKALSDLLDRKN